MHLERVNTEIELLSSGRHTNPHSFLGIHPVEHGWKEIRLWAPRRQQLSFYLKGQKVDATLAHEAGLFTYMVEEDVTKDDYKIIYPSGLIAEDPYTFLPTLSTVDTHLFSQGTHYKIYEVLGSHVCEHQGVKGVKFAVWAPNASRVSLVHDHNQWKEFAQPMRRIYESGIWEIFIPGIGPGIKYKYSIRTPWGNVLWKTDPYSHEFELRPKTASVVTSAGTFEWQDGEWMKKRAQSNPVDGPMNIYEMHIGSWKKKEGRFYNYRELAVELAPYLKEMGFTHLEIMPITEHPLDESWGYQVTGYYAATSRFGNLDDFQFLINHLHANNIGVILDWAPGHFPSDDYSLAKFDGTPVYEKDDPVMSWNPEWGTFIFDYAKKEVSNFLIGSALFWLEKMHVDGIRVDAIQSMLYLNYGRKEGEWTPNIHGNSDNLDAIEFIKHLNSMVHEKIPGVLMVAEDASLYPGITRPVEWGGLGFDLKWNLGWMHDTLSFISRDPIHRKYHMNELFLGYDEIFRERYILPISHDEVVYGKKSLFEKMPHDEWRKFAHLRLYYSSALCHPGKHLFFMGTEIGQREEWDVLGEIHWHLLGNDNHAKWRRFVRDANHFYLHTPPLWQIDFDPKGFAWIDRNDYDHSVISYLRKGVQSEVVCVHNFTPTCFDEYFIRQSNLVTIKEVFNSDDLAYSGTGRTNPTVRITDDKSGFIIRMPPLATMIFEVTF